MSKLIFIRGIPGAGKSRLAQHIKNTGKNTYSIVEPESINLISTEKDPIKKKLFKYRVNLKSCIGYLEEDTNVIWAQPWTKISGINTTIDLVCETYSGPLEILVIDIAIDAEKGWERAQHKLKPDGYSWEKYYKEYFMGKEPFYLKGIRYEKVKYNQLEGILERLEL